MYVIELEKDSEGRFSLIRNNFVAVRRTALQAAVASGVGLAALAPALASGTTTPIASVTTAIDFTDLQTDLTAMLTAALALFIVISAFKIGVSWIKKLATG